MKPEWQRGAIEGFEGIKVTSGCRKGWFEITQGSKLIQLPMTQIEELILILQDLERSK